MVKRWMASLVALVLSVGLIAGMQSWAVAEALLVTGTDGNDVLASGSGLSVIDGKAGWDRVTFPGSESNARSEVLADGAVRITAVDGRVVTLRNVEMITFEAGRSYFVVMIRLGYTRFNGTPGTTTTTTQPTTTVAPPTTQPTTTVAPPTTQPKVIFGTDGPDVLASGPGSSVIDALESWDRVTFPGSENNARSEVLPSGDVRITAVDGRLVTLRNVEMITFDEGLAYFVSMIQLGHQSFNGTPGVPGPTTTTPQPPTTVTLPTTTQPTTTVTLPPTTTTRPVSTTTGPTGECQPKYLSGDRCYERFFVGVNKSDEMTRHYMVNAVRYETMVLNNFQRMGWKNPLHSMATTGQWVIYYHIESWRGPFGAEAATNMTKQFRDSANDWLATLRDYDPSAPSSANIKVFGFVFNEGVELDPSFYDVYGSYPIVTGWNRTNEESPWLVTDRATGAVFDQNDWGKARNFNDLRVAGNRTDVASSVRYSPANWAGYRHPENVDMFYTKFWFKNSWDAVAQRQYLKMGGTVQDFKTGNMHGFVLRHEMGHTMFHDDIYSEGKYPDGGPLRNETIMHISTEMGDFDAVVQRMIWDVVKP